MFSSLTGMFMGMLGLNKECKPRKYKKRDTTRLSEAQVSQAISLYNMNKATNKKLTWVDFTAIFNDRFGTDKSVTTVRRIITGER